MKIEPDPNALAVDPNSMPMSLKQRDNWVCWRYERRNDSWAKAPVDAQTGNLASATNPDTWTDFETALSWYESNGASGLGYVVDGVGVVGVDLDHCRDRETGEIEQWAREIIGRVDSYTEVSPSGTGVRSFCFGELPDGGNRSGDIELYDDARYLTVTGHRLDTAPKTLRDASEAIEAIHGEHITTDDKDATPIPDAPTTTLDDETLLRKARNSENGALFKRLYDKGDISAYDSHSEAEITLCNLLAFWTGGDETQMNRLFRNSALMRGIWHEKRGDRTYGEMRVSDANEFCDNYYDPNY